VDNSGPAGALHSGPLFLFTASNDSDPVCCVIFRHGCHPVVCTYKRETLRGPWKLLSNVRQTLIP